MPLIVRLKKAAHRNVAVAQDLIVTTMYEIFDRPVLHGGTAIWRCYNGNRFSEDVDAYIKNDPGKISSFFGSLSKKGFVIEKKKIGEKSIFSTLRYERTIVRFEAVFKEADGILKEYETADGNLIAVYALGPEELVAEKVGAYLSRRKIRDLYDIFFLLRHVEQREKVKADIKRMVSHFKEPVDEPELKVLILEGLVPSYGKMLDYIGRWS